ncbi:MAG: YihY/virulence factor BrkB family protein [Nocardioidaceae bacterium]
MLAQAARKIDALQRRHRFPGVVLGVVYKFFDDQGNYLAAIVTYYSFMAIFPLLLIASSVLGFVLEGSPGLRKELLDSALSQFPIIGKELGRPGGVQGSATAVVIGLLTALYGATGLGQAGQNLTYAVWSVPRNSRPNPFLTRLRSLGMLALAGLLLLLLALLTAVAGNEGMFGSVGALTQVVLALFTVTLTTVALVVLFRVPVPGSLTFVQAVPGALSTAVLWHLLQLAGAAYVQHVISRASEMSKTFALVLGLFALIYLAAVVAVLGVELNVVLVRRLYPRALLTPFTDDVDLTPADRRAYASYVRAQRHKGFESIDVSFDEEDEPEQPEQVPEQEPGHLPEQEPGQEPQTPVEQ